MHSTHNPAKATSSLRKKARSLLRHGAALLIVATLLIATGCGPAELLSAEERQIIVLWHTFTGAEAEAVETLTDRFNDANPWQIVLITEYQEDLLDKLRRQDAPESRPDLITIWPKDLQSYVALDMVGVPPTHSPEIADAWGDILPMAGALYEVDGVPQALPLGLATYLAYFNLDWLGDLSYDSEVANWEDFRRTACGATDPLRGQIGVGVPARASLLLAFLAASGSEIVGEDDYYQFSDESGRAAASVLHAVMSAECGMVYQDRDEGLARLSKSSMAMIVESSEYLSQVQRAILAGRNFQLGVSPLPGSAGPGPTLWYGPGLMISAPEGERQVAALRALAWFFSPESQRYWGQTTEYIPIRRSVVEAELERIDQMPLVSSEISLLEITLNAADSGDWVAWPQATNRIACRAALLRGLLALQEMDADTDAYVETAVTACNTGVGFRTEPSPSPTPDPETP
ncbi:MAG: ABC transporter substrate-binding protein [Anaerolineae bacterium]